MNKIIKKAAAIVTALAVVATAAVFDVPEGIVAEATLSPTSTGGCDGDHTGMTEWTGTGGELSSGSYYLTGNVDLTSEIKFNPYNGATVTLCLNGYTIKAASNKNILSISNIYSKNVSFTLCDCNSSKNGQGKLTGSNTSSSAGAVNVGVGGSFTMHGGTISGNTAGNGGGVYVSGNGTFNMYGGTISGNTASDNCGGVYVSNGTFNMYGGTISGNMANGGDGGGVYVNNGSGTFTMNGGTIGGTGENSANKATKGGGVYVIYGTFNMNDGTISGNTADDGGGVYVQNDGKFTMDGGTISGNEAKGTTTFQGGGGVCVDGEFTMNGGKISSNTATSNGGGVWLSFGTFTINGKVDISENKKNDSSANNVSLYTNKTITIGSGFDTDSPIGVNTEKTPTCKESVNVTNEATSDISGKFTADINGQSIVYNDGKVQLTVAHDTAKYTAAKAATCTENGNKEYWYCSNCKKYFSDSSCTTETTLAATVITKLGHDFSTAWTTDSSNHWHKCTNTSCTAVSGKAAHSFTQKSDGTNH